MPSTKARSVRPNVSHVAVIYCRVSTEEQEENTSLPTQEATCRSRCAELGYTVLEPPCTDVQSGHDFYRPGLEAALDAIRAGRAGVLMVSKLDRLARDTDYQKYFCVEVRKKYHGQVESATEPIDDTPSGRLLETVLGGLAEFERTRILERTYGGKRARAEQGNIVPGATPLYGYCIERSADGKRRVYIPDEDTAPILQRIFHEYAAGRSLKAILRSLDDEHVPTPSQVHAGVGRGRRRVSSKWDKKTVLTWLHHPAYKGDHQAWRTIADKDEQAGRMRPVRSVKLRDRMPAEKAGPPPINLPPEACPSLVDEVTWNAVQDRLRINQEQATRNNQHSDDQLLRAGYAVCGYCGRSMIVKYRNDPHHHSPRYICYASRGECPGKSPSVLQERLEQDVLEKVTLVLERPGLLAAAARKRAEAASPPADLLQAKLGKLNDEIQALTNKQRTWMGQAAEYEYGSDEYNYAASQAKNLSRVLANKTQERDDVHARLQPAPVSIDAWERTLGIRFVDRKHQFFVGRGLLAADAILGTRQYPDTDVLTVAEKRKILEYYGVRVVVFRRDEPQQDNGTHWRIEFSPEGQERALALAAWGEQWDRTIAGQTLPSLPRNRTPLLPPFHAFPTAGYVPVRQVLHWLTWAELAAVLEPEPVPVGAGR